MPDEKTPPPDGTPAPVESDGTPVPVEPVEPVETGYTAAGVPTFESVREKIETRYGTAVGAAELDADTPEGRSAEEMYDARQRAATERLAQIRESMRDETQ
jgi:phage shock protein A